VIEPTDEMRRAFEDAFEAAAPTDGMRFKEDHLIQMDAGLAAVLTIVERDYCLQPPGHASRSPRPKWPLGRGGSHPHYCVSCSDGVDEGPGCMNCRWTGMDQTPWPNCEACQ
jgi:hypothetical protein